MELEHLAHGLVETFGRQSPRPTNVSCPSGSHIKQPRSTWELAPGSLKSAITVGAPIIVKPPVTPNR